MRVALHTGQLRQPVPGGIGRYVEGLLTHLPGAGVELRRFDGNPFRYELWHRFRRLPRPAAVRGADLVHAPSLAIPPTGGRPLVVTVHDLAFLTHPDCFPPRGLSFHRRALAIAKREAAAVVVPSRFTGDELVEAGFAAERVNVAHHGIDPLPEPPAGTIESHLRTLGLDPAVPFLLFVGTIEPRKGVDVLLAAYQALRTDWPEVRLVIAGPPGWGDEPDLSRDGVLAPGRVAEAALDALYRRAQMLVIPSRTEGFGLPALEAMARGCPVLCSDRGALPEVVGDAGVIVAGAERDPDVLAGAIAGLLGDTDRGVHLTHAGRRRSAEFTWAASADAHRAAYTSLLGAAF